MRKDVSVAVRVNNRHHFLNVGFFAESGPKKDDHSVNVLADTTLTMAERLDKWQPNGAGDLGTYMTIQIEVQPITGTHYAPGDKVKIVYLPEDPTVAMLKEELDH